MNSISPIPVTISSLSLPSSSSLSANSHNLTTKKAVFVDEIDILPLKYYRDIAPVVNGEPVQVKVSVVILNMKISPGSDQVSDF